MIWHRRMNVTPDGTVTRRTVAAQCKGLGIGAIRRHQAAVGIMTAGTSVMRIICSAHQRGVRMAAVT